MKNKPRIRLYRSGPAWAAVEWYCSSLRSPGFGYGATPKIAFEQFEKSQKYYLKQFGHCHWSAQA